MKLTDTFAFSKPARSHEAAAGTSVFLAFNKTRESFLALRIGPADSLLARLRGLLGRSSFKSGEGLWYRPSQGLHTIGIRFPVDLVYLDSQYRVIHLVEHLAPFSFSPLRLECASVLELPAHTIYGSDTRVGDDLLICQATELNLRLAQPPTLDKLPIRTSRSDAA